MKEPKKRGVRVSYQFSTEDEGTQVRHIEVNGEMYMVYDLPIAGSRVFYGTFSRERAVGDKCLLSAELIACADAVRAMKRRISGESCEG